MNLLDFIYPNTSQPTLLDVPEAAAIKKSNEVWRQIVMAGKFVDYRIVRSAKRRTLTLMVDQHGLRVQAPMRLSEKHIISFLCQKTDWIMAGLLEAEKRKQFAAGPLQLWVLGQAFDIKVINMDELTHSKHTGIDVLQRTFWHSSDEVPKEAARLALMAFAKREIAKRLPPWAGKMDLALPRWKISRAETRWGSCSRDTGLRFSWKLACVFPMLMDYVIVHELAHIRHMNHSPRFWREVEKYYPSWQLARKELRGFEKKLLGW